MWSPKGVIGFRVRVNISDNDGDWEMVCDDGLMMNIDGDDGERDHIDVEKHCGVGVVPRMAPPPSQGGST